MSRCKYVYDKIAGRVLVPNCMGVAVHQNLSYCTCGNESRQYEKKAFNEAIKEKDEKIKGLEAENAKLWRIIRNYNKSNRR